MHFAETVYNIPMTQYTKAIRKSALADGEKITVTVSGKHLMIANVGGNFFAVDDACTHAGCSLGGMGKLKGSTITCGCHGGQFNVTDGKVVALPSTVNVTSYPVKIEGDDVMVLV